MGLVQYESSDEDEDVQMAEDQPQNPPVKPATDDIKNAPEPTPQPSSSKPHQSPPPQPTNPSPKELGPVLGPALGPSKPPPNHPHPSQQLEDQEEEPDLSFLSNETNPQPPRSPHTTTRTLLHDLTLPSVPNMDIPPSPPGTPPPNHSALTAKFDTFLRLKRTQPGTHFNARLAASSAMRNPGVMDKLLGFVGVETEFGQDGGEDGEGRGGKATEQYGSVLSAGVWDPHCFPGWAYKGELRKAQERGTRERERGKGEAVEFVSAGSAGGVGSGGSAGGSRSGTPGVGGGRKKGRFDT